jgi:hypothetical protein
MALGDQEAGRVRRAKGTVKATKASSTEQAMARPRAMPEVKP